jgi:hypothetical protein
MVGLGHSQQHGGVLERFEGMARVGHDDEVPG